MCMVEVVTDMVRTTLMEITSLVHHTWVVDNHHHTVKETILTDINPTQRGVLEETGLSMEVVVLEVGKA